MKMFFHHNILTAITIKLTGAFTQQCCANIHGHNNANVCDCGADLLAPIHQLKQI